MAEEKKALHYERLPIKVILPDQAEIKPVKGFGPDNIPFTPVTEQFRERLSTMVLKTYGELADSFKTIDVAPARLRLIKKAFAKSHRPENLFSDDTCPIIGAGKLGELFIKATSEGLLNLNKKIKQSRSEKLVKEISSIMEIEPITPKFRLNGFSINELEKNSPIYKSKKVLRVQLFNFGEEESQSKLLENFFEICERQSIYVRTDRYLDNSSTYGVECRTSDDIEILSNIIGVRSISKMPLIRAFYPKGDIIAALPDFKTRNKEDEDIPVVVVVDTGVTENISALNSWVVGRESLVAPPYRNNLHGTFIAGLLCWGDELNPSLQGIDKNSCGIFDLQVLPNDDPIFGEVEGLTEDVLVVALEDALKKYANKYKVWNLSLGANEPCVIDAFSPIAVQLDELQQKYQVSFVISAGNYDTKPYLHFPRKEDENDKGRITPPADSVLGISVGSISHINIASEGPAKGEPSSFSRHGPGPNYIIKPDLVHFGGSCSIDGKEYYGVRSISENGLIQGLGTSYSAPLVSRTLAQIYHQITPSPSPVLAKALLIHNSRDPRSNGRVPAGEEDCFGFGLPLPTPYCIECSPYSSTLIFEDTLRPGYTLEWDGFPYPPSLCRDGRFFGEIWMTLAFAPSRNLRWGAEYCEAHIEAHFGVHRNINHRDGSVENKFVGMVPIEHSAGDALYEDFQVKNLRKWAPVRSYYNNLGEKGERGESWRLMVRLYTRHYKVPAETYGPQPFALIITIADPEKKASIYDEMARIIRTRFQSQNLGVRVSQRLQART